MSGNADTYLDALDVFDAAEKRLRSMIDRADAIVGKCRGATERVVFLGTGIGLPWPEGAAAHAIPVPEGDWPDAGHLQQALADWHAAREAARGAWEVLSPRLKTAGLRQPPPPLKTDAPAVS